MVLNGVTLVLGYKLSESDIRELFKSDSESESELDSDKFDEFVFGDFISKKLKKYKPSFVCILRLVAPSVYSYTLLF